MPREPLSREELQVRLDEALMRAGAYIQVMSPMGDPEFDSLAGRSHQLEKKLFQSTDRDEQEKLLAEIETIERTAYEKSEKFMAAAREGDKGKMEEQCEMLIKGAVQRVAGGEEKQNVYAETARRLEDVERGMLNPWKGNPPRVAHSYIEKLAETLRVTRHLFPWEIEGRLAEIRKGSEEQQEGREKTEKLESQLFDSRNRGEQEALLKGIEALRGLAVDKDGRSGEKIPEQFIVKEVELEEGETIIYDKITVTLREIYIPKAEGEEWVHLEVLLTGSYPVNFALGSNPPGDAAEFQGYLFQLGRIRFDDDRNKNKVVLRIRLPISSNQINLHTDRYITLRGGNVTSCV